MLRVFCAPGPRRSEIAATRTILFPRGSVIRKTSPERTMRDGLAASSFTSTLPPSHAAAASVRLLKKRAAQSHLSSRKSAMTRLR